MPGHPRLARPAMVGEVDQPVRCRTHRREPSGRIVDQDLVDIPIAVDVGRADPEPRPVATQRVAVEITDRVHRRLVQRCIGGLEIDPHSGTRQQPDGRIVESQELDGVQHIDPVGSGYLEKAEGRLPDGVKRSGAADNRGVHIAAAVDPVVARAADQNVLSAEAEDRIIALIAEQGVADRAATDDVVARAAAKMGVEGIVERVVADGAEAGISQHRQIEIADGVSDATMEHDAVHQPRHQRTARTGSGRRVAVMRIIVIGQFEVTTEQRENIRPAEQVDPVLLDPPQIIGSGELALLVGSGVVIADETQGMTDLVEQDAEAVGPVERDIVARARGGVEEHLVQQVIPRELKNDVKTGGGVAPRLELVGRCADDDVDPVHHADGEADAPTALSAPADCALDQLDAYGQVRVPRQDRTP